MTGHRVVGPRGREAASIPRGRAVRQPDLAARVAEAFGPLVLAHGLVARIDKWRRHIASKRAVASILSRVRGCTEGIPLAGAVGRAQGGSGVRTIGRTAVTAARKTVPGTAVRRVTHAADVVVVVAHGNDAGVVVAVATPSAPSGGIAGHSLVLAVAHRTGRIYEKG